MRRLAGGAALVLLLLLAITARPAAADFFSPLSPLLAPVMGSLCKAVACGKGNCTVTTGLPGYRCDCEPGWKQMHVGDSLRFLPCVIPNSCDLAYCGSGGTCKNATGLSYHCECKEGFSNVLNMTTMPCFQDCSYGADCAAIGIVPSTNSNSTAPPAGSASVTNNCHAPVPGSVLRQILPPLLILASLAMGQAT
ncbi:uncharacterized protein [Aegilops tauschii subsp. strangulata]|nr:neurogenic locus notch homolog protein 1 isoform X2 [Aegilops tauschii subsp. strangulata]XP_044376435.1 neurogenic locus notch homolog protein 1-like isoform X2 [Triticum aestivum]